MLRTAIGPYEVIDTLGTGGMGEVLLGHDPRLQRRVALKRLTSHGQAGDDVQARVLREARAAARLNHPNIGSVYDVLEVDDATVIVMEYVEGESLRARLDRGPLPAGEVIALGRQLSEGLAAAHAQGVIHRDLKPSNIQLTSHGTVKILDFGVARLAAPSAQPDSPTTTRQQTLTLGNPGTPLYMAPEQLINGQSDVHSDLYSLGAVLFEMATGRRPYEENDPVGLAVAMSTMDAPAADAVNPRVPHTLSAVIAKALAREPRHRYQSATELGDALALLGDEVPSRPAIAVSRAPVGARPRRLMTAAALAIAMVAVGIPLWLRPDPPHHVAPNAPPVVLAILPPENRAGDIRGDYVGAALASIVATNFGSVSGLTVLPNSTTGELRDRLQAGGHFGVTHIVALTVRAVAPTTVVDAALRRSETSANVWTRTISGDPLTVQRALLNQLATALRREDALPRDMSAEEWARVRKLPTSSAEALQLYSEGRALLDRYDVAENVDRAVELFTCATDLDSRFATAFAALGEALWTQYTSNKRPEVAAAATAAVTKALTLDRDLAPVHYALGLMQSQTGHYEDAIASLRRALALQPENDESHRLLGRVLATAGDYPAAIAELTRAIALRPYWNNYYSLGFVLFASGDYAGAIEALLRTTELHPRFAAAYQMLGTTYHMLGDPSKAIGYYEHAVRLGDTPAAYANLGLAYYGARQYDRAREAYAEAITRQPRKASLHKSLADVYVRLGRGDEARAIYEHAMALARDDLAVNPRDAIAVVLLANCEARLGRRAAAERHIAEATMLAPKSHDIWIRAAKAYCALAQHRAAGHAVRTAVALGYEPNMIYGDDELQPLGSALKRAVADGLAARARKGVRQ